MFVCDRSFDHPDPDNPGYSLHEVDYYAWTPQGRSHRLSVRKNHQTGAYEAYRHYNVAAAITIQTRMAGRVDAVTHLDAGDEDVAYAAASLLDVLTWAAEETGRQHGRAAKPDAVCEHQGRRKAMSCLEDE